MNIPKARGEAGPFGLRLSRSDHRQFTPNKNARSTTLATIQSGGANLTRTFAMSTQTEDSCHPVLDAMASADRSDDLIPD